MRAVLILLVGVALAGAGGEAFLRGAVGTATRLRIRPSVIAVTVAAFATSTPELAVAVTAALDGVGQIALGDALGSNVVNIGVVVGVLLLVGPVHVSRRAAGRDMPTALGAPVLLALLAIDGRISRADAAVLLLAFVAWLVLTVRHTLADRRPVDPTEESVVDDVPAQSNVVAVVWIVVGLAMLIGSARLIVSAVETIGPAIGLDAFTTGAVLVAVATSTPEMATAVIARVRGHHDVGLATAIGSNIFNGLWIVGVTAMIRPIDVRWSEIALVLAAGVATIVVAFPWRDDRLARGRGVGLVAIWAAYVAVLVTLRPG